MWFGTPPNTIQLGDNKDATSTTVRARQANTHSQREDMLDVMESIMEQLAQLNILGPPDRQICVEFDCLKALMDATTMHTNKVSTASQSLLHVMRTPVVTLTTSPAMSSHGIQTLALHFCSSPVFPWQSDEALRTTPTASQPFHVMRSILDALLSSLQSSGLADAFHFAFSDNSNYM
jgi:hypothetical protein